MSTTPAARVDEFPLDEIVCGCANMTLGQLYQAMAKDPDLPFDEWLARTGSGETCTACLLDLEYFYVNRPPDLRSAPSAPRGVDVAVSLKQRLYRAIDSLAPLAPLNLTEYMPVIRAAGVEEWLWVANHSLLYENEHCGPDLAVDVTVRDQEGLKRHSECIQVAAGGAARVKLSEHLPAPAEQGARPIPAIGVVEITRRYRRAGVRGTTRPQVEIVAPAGSCAVHSQAPGSVEGWFTCFQRPADERLFLSVVNALDRPMALDFEYPFVDLPASGVAPVSHPIAVPPLGARLHEVALDEAAARVLDGRAFSIRWRPKGRFKVHVICATPALDRFSIDHL